MRAIQFDRYGEPAQVLRLGEVAVPEPGDEEVRVRILASPINPSDLLFLRGLYAGVQPSFPAPAGFEGVGLVDAAGRRTQGFVRGQRVAVLNGEKGGNWAEYAVVPENRLFPVPDDLSTEQVASFFINPASAIVMLRHVLAVPRGEWLLQSAAGSELGRMIIKLARHDGIRTINVVRRHASVAELEQLGADAVVVSTEGPIDERVRGIVGAQGVKYAIDPVGGETGTQIYQSLSDEGRMLVYGALTREPIRVGADPRLILAGHRILEVFWLGEWFKEQNGAELHRLFEEIVALIREGALGTTRARTFSLDEIGAAVKQAETPGRQGKVLLVPAKPSDALTAWQKAFTTKDAKAFAQGFAENVVLEASVMRKPVEGRDRVRQMLWTAAEIYESLAFTDQASSGRRTYIEWVATAFGGKQLRGSTILVTNEEGQIEHAVVQHRPLDGLLTFSAEMGKRMSSVEDAESFWKGCER